MGSYGIGVVPRGRGDRRAAPTTSSACAGRARSRRPTCTSSPTGKDDAVFDAAQALADDLVAAGARGALRRPARRLAGVKFKDAELLGMPTIVVVGQGPRRRRRRGARPAHAASARTSPVADAVAVRAVVRVSGRPTAVRTAASRRSSSTGAARSRPGTRSTCASSGARYAEVYDPDRADELSARILSAEDDGVAGRAGSTSGQRDPRRALRRRRRRPGRRPARRGAGRLPRASGSRTRYTDPDVAAAARRRCGSGASGSACCPTRCGPATTTRRSSAATACST